METTSTWCVVAIGLFSGLILVAGLMIYALYVSGRMKDDDDDDHHGRTYT